jgi:hypothetical protein
MLDHSHVISSNEREVGDAARGRWEAGRWGSGRTATRCTPRWPPGRPFGLHGVPGQRIRARALAQGVDRPERAERVTGTAGG